MLQRIFDETHDLLYPSYKTKWMVEKEGYRLILRPPGEDADYIWRAAPSDNLAWCVYYRYADRDLNLNLSEISKRDFCGLTIAKIGGNRE